MPDERVVRAESAQEAIKHAYKLGWEARGVASGREPQHAERVAEMVMRPFEVMFIDVGLAQRVKTMLALAAAFDPQAVNLSLRAYLLSLLEDAEPEEEGD
jgi:hypothetical protein